jgi:hypothetical protein
MSEPAAGQLLVLKWKRLSRTAAVLACGSLAAVIPGCLLPVAPLGGRLMMNAMLDALLGWMR